MLRCWNRLITFNNDIITKQLFEFDYEKSSNNWCSEIKAILTSLDLLDVYDRKILIDLKIAEQRLINLYKQNWRNSVHNSRKLRTYLQFKGNFRTEDYVLLNLSKYERSIVAQFRCGILPLRIETGRYINESVNERLCKFCSSNAVEDEMHFLIYCS